MSLAANVARRGGVYWWRGRVAARRHPSRVVAKSLRTRDPEVARVLGLRVTGLAVHLRQSVRQGVMTIEEAEGEISNSLTKFAFSVDPNVIAQLEAEKAEPSVRCELSNRYSAAQETAMLSDFVRRTLPILERQTAEARTYPPVVIDGVAEDRVAEAARSNRLQAEVCRLLAVYGGSARVLPEDRTDLLANGCSEDEVDEIERQLRLHAGPGSGHGLEDRSGAGRIGVPLAGSRCCSYPGQRREAAPRDVVRALGPPARSRKGF